MATKVGSTLVSSTGSIGPVTITAGDAVIIGLKFENGATLNNLSDGTNTCAVAIQKAFTASPAEPEAAIAYILNHPGGSSLTFTASFTGSATFINMTLEVWNGLGSTDGTPTSNEGTGSTFSSGAITTTGSGLVVQFVGGFQTTTGVVAGGSPTFTRDTTSESGESFMQYLISGSGQTVTPGASWGAASAPWVMVAAAFKDGVGGGPSITSTSSSTIQEGQTLTINGSAFGASQGAGFVTLGGNLQTVTSWSDTVITVTVSRGTNKYGTAYSLQVTDNSLTGSNTTNITITPRDGWSYVNLGAPASANRLSAYPDLASGNQIAYQNKGGRVEVFVDSTFVYTPYLLSFDFEVWNSTDFWGYAATQYLDPQVTATGSQAADVIKRRRRKSALFTLDDLAGLKVEKWFADELTASASSPSHDAVGALVSGSATVAGTATHLTLHTTTGALAASSAVISGAAAHQHATAGALSASAATIAGTAAHFTLHATSGALLSGSASIAGAADHAVPGGTHATDGALIAGSATVAGTAAHLTLHATSGALAAGSAVISGASVHPHIASGALVSDAATISGAANSSAKVTHTTTGALVADPATIYGAAIGPGSTGGGYSDDRPRKRGRFLVQIGKQVFAVDSVAEAQSLMDKADAEAKEAEAESIAQPVKAKKIPKAKLLPAPKPVEKARADTPDAAIIAKLLSERIASYNATLAAVAKAKADEDEDDQLLMLL